MKFDETVKTDIQDAEALAAKVLTAIEKWYGEHFHHAAVSGTAPISSADKAALVNHVTNALNSKE